MEDKRKVNIHLIKNHTIYGNLVATIISLLSLLSYIYIVFNNREYGYEKIYLLPLAFSIISFIFSKVFIYSYKSIGLSIFNIIEFLRFVCIPFIMVQTGFYNSTFYGDPTDTAKQIVIYLMLYQLVIEYIFIYYYLKKVAFKSLYESLNKHNTTKYKVQKYRWRLLVSAIILIILAVVTNFSGNNYRVSMIGYSTIDTGSNYILGEIALQCSIIILYMFFTLPDINKYASGTNILYKIKFLVLSLLFIGINFGDVRMFFAIKAVMVISLILKYFNKKEKIFISSLVALSGFLSIFIMTMSDANASHGIFYFTGTENDKSTYAYTLQKYFSGPYNIAKSIDILNLSSILEIGDGIQLLINDIFINTFPFNLLNIDQTMTTKIIFNYNLYGYYGRSTQIIPLLGQGILYFGYIFSPIPTLVLLKVMMSVEKKMISISGSNNQYIYFIMSFYSIYLGFMNMYNISIIIGTILNVLIPIHIIVLLQEISMKKVRFKL